uniref:Uncharacterized protein n=1 Tax=Trichogramma kaykai TaxID=54128 RepID=A0ABD2WTZ4_9HYME
MRRASNSFVCAVDQLELLRCCDSLYLGDRLGHYAPRAKRKIFICKKHRARKRLRGYIGTVSAGLALIRNP